FTCINRIGSGMIHHSAAGWIRIGEHGGGNSPRAARTAELLTAAQIDCAVLDDLRLGRWEKLSWNIPFNGLGAVLDWTTDRLIASEEGIALVKGAVEEVVACAAALGMKLTEGIAQLQVDRTLPLGAYESSMQIDRREG